MADGAGQSGPSMQGFWQAQAELAKQVNRISEMMGGLSAQQADRVTHKDMMSEFSSFRKEVGGKLDHMETKFDQTVSKVESIIDRSTARQADNWRAIADESVSKEMIKRDAQEQKARETVKRNDDELERKIRQANRNSVIGGGVGIVGLIAAIVQYLQGAGL